MMGRPAGVLLLLLAALLAEAGALSHGGEEELRLRPDLRILALIPNAGSSGRATNLYGRTAITIVYSRAVIALGSDWNGKGDDGKLPEDKVPFLFEACDGQPEFAVPGKIRWPTTSTARFDVEVDWPTDLCFDIVPNPKLRSFDGLKVASEQKAWRFTTSPMNLRVSSVRSKDAQRLTGGMWTSSMLGDFNSNKHECPPDGVVHLSFSTAIDHEIAFKTLQGANKELLRSSDESNQFTKCGRRCLAIPLGLKAGRDYRLVFPQAGRYSLIAGAAAREQGMNLVGLLPFDFPFRIGKGTGLRFRRHRLYLRHGLAAETPQGPTREQQIEALKAAMTLTDESGVAMHFNLSLVNNATLLLDCPKLEPEWGYVLAVKASDDVRDGYGQPLQECSSLYRMEGTQPVFSQPTESPAYFRDSPGDWKVLAGGSRNYWCQKGDPMNCPSGNRKPFRLRAWNVSPSNLMLALAQRNNQEQDFLVGALEVLAPAESKAQALSVETSQWVKEVAGGQSGLFLREVVANYGTVQRGFVSVAAFGASLVATGTDQLLVWAYDYATGAGVSGAGVTIYRVNRHYRAQPTDVVQVAMGVTSANGTVLISPTQSWRQDRNHYGDAFYAIVQLLGESAMAICEETPVPQPYVGHGVHRAVLLTDRAIYRPGDSVHVKGYLRNVNGAGTMLSLPKDAKLAVEVVWKRSNMGKAGQQRVEVELVPEYGTFAAELKVPTSADDVTYGATSVNLIMKVDARRNDFIGTATLTVADPRPPTAMLKLSTEDKLLLPGAAAAVDVDVKTETYSGSVVEGAEVEVTWTVHRKREDFSGGDEVIGVQLSPRTSPEPWEPWGAPMLRGMPVPGHGNSEATGQITVVTGKGGKGSKKLDLAELLKTAGEDGAAVKPAVEGDTLSLKARWVGPTREVITAELEGGDLRIARSQYVLAIKPALEVDSTVGTPLPGTPFPLFVDLRRADGGISTEMGAHGKAEVTISLHEWDGKAALLEDADAEPSKEVDAEQAKRHTGLLPVSDWGKEAVATCNVGPDGAAAALCGDVLVLPEPKKYVVLARVTAPDGIPLVTAFAVGKTEKEWAARPLASLGEAFSVHADQSSYKVGETAKFIVSSPFRNASALLVWEKMTGEKRNTHHELVSLGKQGSEHVIDFPVGEECRYGCSVVVLLAAPSQKEDLMLPVRVPVSPLLDVTLPHTVARTLRLDVPDMERKLPEGEVRVAVLKDEKATEVLEPGETVTIEVKAAPKAEVCIFVVDKAMLDVGGAAHPHPVVKLDQRFELRRTGSQPQTADTAGRLASAKGMQATVDTTLRRAAIDPWTLEPSWALHPHPNNPQPVDQSDKEFFAARTDAVTHFPSGYGIGGFDDVQMLGRGGPMPMAMPMMAEAEEMGAMDMAADAMPAPPAIAMMASRSRSFAGASLKSMKSKSMNLLAEAAPRPSSAPATEDGGSGGGGSASLGKAAYTRTNFETTPLFVARQVVGEVGSVKAELKLPDNIATFEVRVYVVDGSREHRFGHATASVISRRQVSMVPSLPRVVRPGDKFDCGVSVTGHVPTGEGSGLPSEGVEVVAKLASRESTFALVKFRTGDLSAFGVKAMGDAGHGVVLGAKEGASPHEVLFPLQTPSVQDNGGVGTSRFTFTARTHGGTGRVLDALEANITVKPNQSPVQIGTSMVITASTEEGSKEWTEGLELPDAAPGSGAVVLTAGVGHLPAVVADAADVTGRDMTNGQTLAAALLPAPSLAMYYAPGSPPSKEAAVNAGLEKVASTFAQALRTLPGYTDTDERSPYPLGLVFRTEEMQHGWYSPRADVSLNAYALLAARLVAVLVGKSAERSAAGFLEGVSGAWAVLNLAVPGSLTSAWQNAVERELQRQVAELRSRSSQPRCSHNCYKSWETLAQVRAALGWEWQPQDAATREELAFDRLFQDDVLEQLSPQALAHAALAYTLSMQVPEEAQARLDAIYHRLANLVRVQGRTTYIAAANGSPHSAGLHANAMVLLALAQGGKEAMAKHFVGDSGSSLVAKLAEYVAGGGTDRYAPFGGGRWMAVRDAAIAGSALALYDGVVGSTQPDVFLSALGGSKELMQYRAKGAAPPPATEHIAWEELARSPPPISFVAEGKGQVSITASLTFVPAAVPTEGAIVRGCLVEKVVQRMDPATGKATGLPLQVAELGSSVVVTIQVTVVDDLPRVTLEDPSAGGLEPVDPNVAGDEAGSTLGGCRRGRFGFMWWWCYPAFPHRETFADRVAWSSRMTLPAGTHTVSYQAVAATRGVFTLPPSHCFADNQPELMGLSRAGTIVVANSDHGAVPDPADQAAVETFLAKVGVEKLPTTPPMPCHGQQPEGAACDTAHGKWVCFKNMKFGPCEPIGDVQSKWDEVVTPIPKLTPYRPSATASGAVLVAMLAALSMVACYRKKARGAVLAAELCPCPGSTPYVAAPAPLEPLE